MKNMLKFKKALPRKKKKRPKHRISSDKRNIINIFKESKLNLPTKEKAHNRKVFKQNKFNRLHPSKTNDPSNFKINEEEIDKTFSFFELTENNNFTSFSGDDPSALPSQMNLGINEPFFENDKIS